MRNAGRWLFLFLVLVLPLPARADQKRPTIKDFAKELSSANVRVRRKAAWALWQRRARAKPVAVALAAAIRDPDDYVRNTCARTVAGLLYDEPKAVPELVRALSDLRVSVRRDASRLLGSCYDSGSAARDPLIKAMTSDRDAQVRANAANALRIVPIEDAGPAVPALVQATADGNASVRRNAVSSLSYLGRSKILSVAPQLLDDPDAGVRAASLAALCSSPQFAKETPAPVAEKVAKLMRDPDAYVRQQAASALGASTGQRKIALAALLRGLEDGVVGVRSYAADAIGRLKPTDPKTLDVLAKSLLDPKAMVRAEAARALAESGPAGAREIPAIARALSGFDDAVTRYATARALAKLLGPLTKQAVPALEADTMRDLDWSTLQSAATLVRVRAGDRKSLDLLVGALSDKMLGSEAAGLLSDLGDLAAPAVPKLVQLSSGDDATAVLADMVLVRVSYLYREKALSRLAAIIESPKDPRKSMAVNSLGSVGSAAVPILVKVLEGPDASLKTSAEISLANCGSAAKAALSVLQKLAKSGDSSDAQMARYAVAQIKNAIAAEQKKLPSKKGAGGK